MKAKHIIQLLQDNPEADLIFWDGDDNYDIENVELDAVNGIEIIFNKQMYELYKKSIQYYIVPFIMDRNFTLFSCDISHPRTLHVMFIYMVACIINNVIFK